jgi:hypothetical protein
MTITYSPESLLVSSLALQDDQVMQSVIKPARIYQIDVQTPYTILTYQVSIFDTLHDQYGVRIFEVLVPQVHRVVSLVFYSYTTHKQFFTAFANMETKFHDLDMLFLRKMWYRFFPEEIFRIEDMLTFCLELKTCAIDSMGRILLFEQFAAPETHVPGPGR